MRITSSLFEAFLKCPTKCWLRAAGEPTAGNVYAEWVKTQNESYRVAETNRLVASMPPSDCAVAPSPDGLKSAKWRLAFEVVIRATASLHRGRSMEVSRAAYGPSETGVNAASGSLANGSSPGSSAGGSPDSGADTNPAAPQPTMSPPTCHLETCLHLVERVPAEGRGKAAQFLPIRFVFFNKLAKDDKLLLAYDAFVLRQALGRDIAVGKVIHGNDHAVLKVKTSGLAGEVRKRLEKFAMLL